MTCAILKDTERCVIADSEDAERRIRSGRERDMPMTLILRRPVPMDLLRMAGYSPKNTVHVFAGADADTWGVPYLAAAGRCGVRSAVTIYPIIPGWTKCVDVLEMVTPLAINHRTKFFFMFPRIPRDVTTDGDICRISGKPVNPAYVRREGDRYYPSAAYIRRFMQRARCYFDCTPHSCGICGKDCALCTGMISA